MILIREGGYYLELREYLDPKINWAALMVFNNFTDVSILSFILLLFFYTNKSSFKEILFLYFIILLNVFNFGSDFAKLQIIILSLAIIFNNKLNYKFYNKIFLSLITVIVIFFLSDLHHTFNQFQSIIFKTDQEVQKSIDKTYYDDENRKFKLNKNYNFKKVYEHSYYRSHYLRFLASKSSLSALKDNIFFGKGTYDLTIRAKKHNNVEDENYFTRILSSYGLIGGLLLPLIILIKMYLLILDKYRKKFLFFISYLVLSLPSEGYIHHSNSIFLNEIKTK